MATMFAENLRAVGDVPLRDWLRGHTEEDVPSVRPSPLGIWKWLIDEWTLQTELTTGRFRIPDAAFRRRLRDELAVARDLYGDRGWLADPASYHQTPPPMGDVEISRATAGPYRYEHVRFESGFEPYAEEPGRDRWLDYRPVKTGHAWMLRHEDDAPRPWIVLINGYRTGDPLLDLSMFKADRLHRRHGLNVITAVLPLHGPRSIGGSNGGRVLHAGAMNTVFTLAQGAWDVRRLIGWVRSEFDATAVGLSGISLGGYMSGLVSALEDDLSCVIAGVPEADLARGMRRQIDPILPPWYEQWGLSWEPLEQVLSVVSPMSMPCKVPVEGRYIYAGLLDRWVRPGNVRELWDHWERPEICWYDGSHLSFPFEPAVRRFVDKAVGESLLS